MIGGAVAGLALVAGVAVALSVREEPLPAPRTLARDPVPAERIFTVMPANCGISAGTVEAVAPHARIEADGSSGTCRWWSKATSAKPARGLSVTLKAERVTPAPNGDNSAVAVAIRTFAVAARAAREERAIAGLGDEAFAARGDPARTGARQVVFRAGNLVVTVAYETEGTAPHATGVADADLRAAALRAAKDTAGRLGVRAAPRTSDPGEVPDSLSLPDSMCALVPADLRERLVGPDPEESSGDGDPLARSNAITRPATRTCALRSAGRELTIALTGGTVSSPALAIPDTDREYLRRYLELRAERPTSAHPPRYFHALAGLGDRAVAALSGTSPARVVAQAGTALVTITYAGIPDDDVDPLTRTEAVNGAYAAATHVVPAVRP